MSPEAAHRLTDKEAVNLIFGAGFSTASVVSEVSGRGVGMDIVRSNLQKLGAQIDIESKVGAGSTFLVRLPLTLAIIRGLLVTVRGSVYALPLASVVETVKVEADAVHIIAHREVVVQRGRTLPIVRLRDVFRLEAGTTPAERALNGSPQGEPEAAPETTPRAEDSNPGVTARQEGKPDALYLVIVGLAEKQIGLAVDSLVGEQEIVIKTLGKFIGDIRGISGATILGDGRVALIVDANGLAHLALEEKGKAYAA